MSQEDIFFVPLDLLQMTKNVIIIVDMLKGKVNESSLRKAKGLKVKKNHDS